jgi:hypothetical protein
MGRWGNSGGNFISSSLAAGENNENEKRGIITEHIRKVFINHAPKISISIFIHS